MSEMKTIIPPVTPITTTRETLLNGPDWKLGSYAMDQGEPQEVFLPKFDDSGFRTVKVPGEVQLQIGLQGMDLYYQSKQLTLVNEQEWWYRKRFVAPKGDTGKLLRLVFDGVDYFAAVWLNGEKLGEHEGCYVPFSYEVSSKLIYGAENLVVVKVTCPWVPKGGRGFLEYLKGEFGYASSSSLGLASPPFRLGPFWDGIPATGNAVFPMGLFRDVKLVASGAAVIDDLFVTTKSLNVDGSATLGVSGTIKNYADQDLAATLDLKMGPDNFSGEAIPLPRQPLSIHPGENSFRTEVVVKNPQLWWTWDLGAQNLYKLTATISAVGGGGEDSRTTGFGIRTIARNSDMSYWLNGERLFLKGAFYPISDYFGSRPTRETYEKDLEMYRAANLNHLVAFTVVEKPEFYDLCDHLGILVMFEFPMGQEGPGEVLAYANPRREIFVEESLSQFRQIIIELRNHPSTILWAAFAEARSRVKGENWGPLRDTEYGYEEYANQIGKLVEELAPGTIYHPSICDMGERHFWNASAGIGTTRGYQDHFNVDARFVSEYGSVAFPVYETLQKMLTPEEMWSTENGSLPRWFNLPLNIPIYAYQTSFEYEGLASALQRVNQFVDRHVKSIQELVDDSQLYQAFLFKYATECYRRKKYNSINGTRIWAYGEVTPGIRFNFLDYYRVPKMGYYFLKKAQERFAINFAYEEALESQVSGKRLRIPVWVINDHQREVPVEVHCEILDLQGQRVGSYDFRGTVGSDESKEVGVVDWVAPDKPGVYVLRGQALERGQGTLAAEDSTFIKVTPRLFSRPFTMLLIGENQYSFPISQMVRAMGINVDVIEENSIHQLAQLRNPEEMRKKYEVVWLACFDSLWKLMDDEMADGLKRAIGQGLGFIHTGGPGSFHGGAGRAALIDVRSLAEVLPVNLRNRDDVIYGPLYRPPGGKGQEFSSVKDIGVAASGGEGWHDFGLKEYGLAGFNDVEVKPGSRQILTISGRPLLVTGQFGQGRTVAFTGFTPAYTEKMWPPPGPQSFSSWADLPIIAPLRYFVDQEFVADPVNRSYFALFMRMIAAASGEKPVTAFDELLAARDQPLFESLKELPTTTLNLPAVIRVTAAGRKANANLAVTNGGGYARLVRVRAEWKEGEENVPYLVKYSDNFFDLLPGESRSLALEMFLAKEHMGRVSGTLVVEGPNIEPKRIPVVFDQKKGEKTPVLTVLERTTEPLLKADRPWEDASIGLDQVLRIGDQWHLWYVAFDHNFKNDNDCYLCYACSKDGVNWEKPSLGIYSYNGSTDNNILMFGFNLASFIFDKKAPPEQRFKGVGARQHGVGYGPWWVYGATSPDGIRWKALDEPLLKKNSDTGNICIRDGDIYRLYVRMWSGGDFKGYRIVGYTESATFGDFPDPVVILSPDKDDRSDMHFYNSATTKLKENLYLMFPSGFFKKDGTVLVYAAFSRDGKQFSRLGRTPLLSLGKGFDNTGIYVSAGAIPGEKPGTYWIYYGGTALSHDVNPTDIHSDGGIGRFLLNVVD